MRGDGLRRISTSEEQKIVHDFLCANSTLEFLRLVFAQQATRFRYVKKPTTCQTAERKFMSMSCRKTTWGQMSADSCALIAGAAMRGKSETTEEQEIYSHVVRHIGR